MAHLVSIAYTPSEVERQPADHYARVAADRAVLIEGRGIEEDVKGKGGRRQINNHTSPVNSGSNSSSPASRRTHSQSAPGSVSEPRPSR